MYLSFVISVDESCGNFNAPGGQKLFVQCFANAYRELPQFKEIGDFIYLFNVEIQEYEGR